MKIIVPGRLPSETLYTGHCPNCGCKFEFLQREAKVIGGDRPGEPPYLSVKCPQDGCDREIFVTLRC